MFVKIDLWKWADYSILKPEKPPDKNGQLSFNFEYESLFSKNFIFILKISVL
jgi:hypothetical protein